MMMHVLVLKETGNGTLLVTITNFCGICVYPEVEGVWFWAIISYINFPSASLTWTKLFRDKTLPLKLILYIGII